ncbi:dipeptide ABC transporter ATP-binding protein [Conexibacter woesei]|uniref:Oligopeptide/dipeptide ABC transporter, ATPase subunit n=1 Tax=Conexibacter woesei (strain DSM 14684 / CCUG 47730 / CIP 108061 / JCM 11494 / NBRC 100937 / ID131577) TaxID=469383 RepID=D3F4H4_CONWI|nr:ABC transporter ATP-binding protein [Conexibacter woesei]ADB50546.1 oligopeptide/dipeptide ABC transporter, ATPase subunit [Conexibacter woesei DSM 14684]
MREEQQRTAPAHGELLVVRDLAIASRAGAGERPIASGVGLEVRAGEAVALVGESGSGKSLTARAILGLLPPGVTASGEVRFKGRDLMALGQRERAELRGREMAVVMQDPFTTLNPVRRCLDQMIPPGRGGRMARATASARAAAAERLAEVGLTADSADRYPFQLSGGMRQRLCIAAALAHDPSLLIADEPSTALDVTTQAEVLRLLRRLQGARGMGVLLITHDLSVAFANCDRVYVLYAGSLVEVAPAGRLHDAPRHPYTLELLLSEPPADRRVRRLAAIPGFCPPREEVLGRCAFETRCRWAAPECREGEPPLTALADGHLSRCRRIEQIGEEMSARLAAARRPAEEATAAEAAAAIAAPLLRVEGLRKVFRGSRGAEIVAVHDVSIAVGRGESVGIVGESGSGKTTTARCIAGLERPTGGTIELAGEQASPGASAIQMIFQDPSSSLNPALSIGTSLREAALAARPSARPTRAQIGELIERVGLPARYAERKPIALSGGERQRIAIARALAAGARLIVCDEPVSALDVSVQAQILNLLADLRAELGLSYLFITHDLAVARQATDRVYVVHQGRVVEEGPVARVLDAPTHPYTAKLVASIPGARKAGVAS